MTRIDWLQVGREYWAGDNDLDYRKRDKLAAICRKVEWLQPPCSLPMAPGKAIKGMIKELKIPKVSHVCYSHELAPFGLIGVRGHYKNATVEVFGVDEGDQVTMLCCLVSEPAPLILRTEQNQPQL